ncbi:tyrosine-protein kinase CSK-like isoform X1 [Biomphalaria glabrata]|uniref:Tyrosine-protein kinase n=1 Tax=Biomphalaria glabrata TaxID=6526 RepID=A0A9W2ZGS8_BIOGL|nr:tyrosine-protein kinase CSK-like isoform X1 [Biomphalaria glabrata]XP_055874158.1 tyrosine-protein kinase CSK-like isoform X1 [Biomphalaria glabrata]
MQQSENIRFARNDRQLNIMPMGDINHTVTWNQGDEVVGLFDFPGRSKDDLPFQKGDLLVIVKSTTDPNWYKAKNSIGAEGMIPANYVKLRKVVSLHAMPWFHGHITREETEALLANQEDGVFLIRDSIHYVGDRTLSVSCDSRIDHYRILTGPDGMVFVDGGDCAFDSLLELVEHYKADADGLCTRLIRPVTKQGNNFVTVSMQDFQKGGWVINRSDLELGELIGKGDFGDVYKGFYKGQAIAAKVLKDQDRGNEQFMKEAALMTSLRHPNLVRLIGIVLSDTAILVTEFVGRGNLVEYLRTRGRNIITKKDQINFATDTCAAMDYLESKSLVHRDLAARNVLVHDDGTAKVSDFGLANIGGFNQTSSQKFPIKWTAPESLRNNIFTNKSDMWSFGILLWEIYSFGRVPYPRVPLSDVVMHVEKGYRMEAPEGCPVEIFAIMKQAWEMNPENRPRFSEVLSKLNHLRSVTV